MATAYLRAHGRRKRGGECARRLVAQAQVLEDHAHEAHVAGTVANLEELRAQGAAAVAAAGTDCRAEQAGERPDPAEARDRRSIRHR